MRLSPVVTLGLTNVGILSWLWYGTAGIDASAYETSEQNTVDEDASAALDEEERVKISAESEAIALNASNEAIVEPSFSPYSLDSISQPDEISLAIAASLPSAKAASETIAFSPAVDIKPEQIEQVVAQTFGPVPTPQIERFKIKAVVAQSFERSAAPALTTQLPLPPLPSSVPSLFVEPTTGLEQSNRSQATEAFYTQSLGTSDRSSALLVAQFTNPESTNVTPPAVPGTSRDLPVLAPPSTPAAPPVPSVPTPTVPSASFPTLSTGVDENYSLGPGDIIGVSFFNVPEYSGQHGISTSGTIDLPLIGRTSVRGLTPNQAGSAIADRYRSQLQSPIVSVNVVQQRPVQVAISGEIVQPGLYTITAQGSDYPRLFQALQQAGGLTQAAALNQVEVRRIDAVGQETTIAVNLLALLQNGDISQNVFLQDGDSVVVPSSTALDMAALSQLAESNLRSNSDRPINVAIVGEVTQPGPYQLNGGSGQATVVQALQTAGGVTPAANLRQVQLRRQTRQGPQQVLDINLWELLQTGDVSQDIALQQGDTLLVPTATDLTVNETTSLAASSLSPGIIQVNIIGEVESPGALSIASNTSFNEALLASGGFNRRAKDEEATLIRFNPDGTVAEQRINIDLSDDVNSETNPLLRPDDVIIVGRSAKAAFDDTFGGFANTFNSVFPFLLLFR